MIITRHELTKLATRRQWLGLSHGNKAVSLIGGQATVMRAYGNMTGGEGHSMRVPCAPKGSSKAQRQLD